MTDIRDEILEFLHIHTTDKEWTGIELVKDESRLENRINEVKTDLKGDIMQVRTDLKGDIMQVRTDLLQVKTDLENNIREVKTDLENDIQIVRNDVQIVRDDIKDRMSGLRWFIGTTVAIAAVIVPLISKYL